VDGWTVEVAELDGRRVSRLRVKPSVPPEESPVPNEPTPARLAPSEGLGDDPNAHRQPVDRHGHPIGPDQPPTGDSQPERGRPRKATPAPR
jgi:hypothetical protein